MPYNTDTHPIISVGQGLNPVGGMELITLPIFALTASSLQGHILCMFVDDNYPISAPNYISINQPLADIQQDVYDLFNSGGTHSAYGITWDVTQPTSETIKVEYSSGTGNDGRTSELLVKGNAPFTYDVVDSGEDSFEAVFELYKVPSFNQFIIFNAPPDDIYARMDVVRNSRDGLFNEYLFSLNSPFISVIDVDNYRLASEVTINCAPLLDQYLDCPLPRRIKHHDINDTFKYDVVPNMMNISTYCAEYNSEVPYRTNSSYGPFTLWSFSSVNIYKGMSKDLSGKYIDYTKYTHTNSDIFWGPLSNWIRYDTSNTAQSCYFNHMWLYINIPDVSNIDLFFNVYTGVQGKSVILEKIDTNLQDTGIVVLDVSDYVMQQVAGQLPSDYVAFYITTSDDSWRSEILYVRYDNAGNSCEECNSDVQEFVYLNCMGVYEVYNLVTSFEENFEGKAVDITYKDIVGNGYSGNRFEHRNRGIRSKIRRLYKTAKTPTTELNIERFRDFITSTNIYKIDKDTEAFIKVIPITTSYSISTNEDYFKLDVEFLEEQPQYTNNTK